MNSQANFAVFCYHQKDKSITTFKVEFPKDFTPEGVFGLPGRSTLCFVSDDGTLPREVASATDCMSGQLLPDGLCPNKFLVDMNERTFRIFQIEIRD
jgi:hypothetical protein